MRKKLEEAQAGEKTLNRFIEDLKFDTKGTKSTSKSDGKLSLDDSDVSTNEEAPSFIKAMRYVQ